MHIPTHFYASRVWHFQSEGERAVMILILMRFRLPQNTCGALAPAFWVQPVALLEGSCRTLGTLQISTQNGYGRALSRCWRCVGCEHCAWKGSLAFSRKPVPMFQNPADPAVPKAGRDALGQDVQAQCMKPSGRILVPGRFY